MRVFLLSLRKFEEDQCALLAAALTLYSLLSIVPVMAMGFGLAKGFGLAENLRNRLMAQFYGQEKVMGYIFRYADSWLKTTQGGIVAGLGALILMYTVIRMLGNIEMALNRIWKIDQERRFSRKVSEYLVVFLVCMFLLIISSGITIFISTQVELIISRINILEYIGTIIFFFLGLLPYTLMWILFVFLYTMMPNTRVNMKAAVPAGIIGGTLFQLAQWGMITLQIGVGSYNVIYGSFAAFPIFLAWLQISWIVFLFGAELGYAWQNIAAYEFEPDCRRVSRSSKKKLELVILHLLIHNFANGNEALQEKQIVRRTDIPLCLVQTILDHLVSVGLLIRISDEERKKSNRYQPALDIDCMNLQFVLERLENDGTDLKGIVDTEATRMVAETLQRCREKSSSCMAGTRLKDLIIRSHEK